MKRWDSFTSTQSLSDDEFLSSTYDTLPDDLYYNDEKSGERVLVAKKGDALPIPKTKLKKRSNWDYAYRFR